MKKQELIVATLKRMGYCPEVDKEGDVMFHYQLKTMYVVINDDDEPYISVLFPQFHEIDDGQDVLVMAVCNKMTRNLKMAKVYVDQTYKTVSASCESFYANEESLELNLKHSIKILGLVRTAFAHEMDELAKLNEDKE